MKCLQVECPNCGRPSGPFSDPRFERFGMPGTYWCVPCGWSGSIVPLLEAADERMIADLLSG